VQLFVARARAACGEFDLTDANAASAFEICRKLDGLPLAIELAAARLRMLPPAALLEGLERGLALLSGGARDAPPRLRSMRDAIAWSYALLVPQQQALFRRLGIFAGGWTLDAVEPVCLADLPDLDPLDGLSSLLDQSLIRRSPTDSIEPRFEMLHEDFTGLGDALHLAGHVVFEAREYAEAQALFARSQAAYARADDALGALALIGDLGMVAYHQADYATAREWFERCLHACTEAGVTDHAADSLNRLGDLARIEGDLDRAEALYAESLALWRSVHGTPGTASALHKLGQTARRRGETQTALRLVCESLELQREISNKQGLVECLAALAGLAFDWSTSERAVELLGACRSALEALDAPLAPVDAFDLARGQARGEASLPAAAWAAADARGRALGLAEALRRAQPRDDVQADLSSVHTRMSRAAASAARSTSAPAAESASAAWPSQSPVQSPPLTGANVLSPREREVAALIARGLSNREVGAALGITEKTAANHLEHIMTKLDLRSRAQVAVWAVRNGST
jgi:non-specific serine/threonine protein kinase